MKKYFKSISEVKSGMQTAETIFNEYGAVIIAKDTTLDDYMIEKIKKLGILKVKIYVHNDEMVPVTKTELFNAQYNENINNVKDILHDISSGKSIDTEKINEVSDSIIVRINENRDIIGCINQMRSSDEYTYSHCVNVSLLCMLIGKWMKLDVRKVKSLILSGFLHDIGKARIPPEILNKPGPLTPDEYSEVKKHTIYGFKLAESIPNIEESVLKGILLHHEREDGSGYPFGLKGERIHEFGKILAVADTYDAMTSNRIFKGKECPFEVFELLENDSFGVLDHKVVNTFLMNIGSYYNGDSVLLSTGDIGEIVYMNPNHLSQPIIKVDDVFVDLSIDTKIKIQELI